MQNFTEIQAFMKSDLELIDQILVNRLDSNVDLISQMSHYIINSGGKRIRPLLLLLCAKATDYKGDYHHSMAVVIELIHTATLLHDDVVDQSTTRRGQDSANELWGNAPSVLVGDFLYSRAFEIMVEPNSMSIMKILSKATNQISEGEVLQLLNIKNASTSEFGNNCTPVVGLLEEWQKGKKMFKGSEKNLGGTMRLGLYDAILKNNSLISKIYSLKKIRERHRHRYEVNIKYKDKFEKKGLIFSALSPDGMLPEIIELKNHPWFVGVQFHPELKSRIVKAHPLFRDFIAASVATQEVEETLSGNNIKTSVVHS